MDKPKMRAVEATKIQTDNGVAFALRDPEGHSPGVITAPAAVIWMLQFFDGNHSIDEVRDKFKEQFGQAATREQMESIVENLDEALMLEGGRYERFIDDYMALENRPAAHAGICYLADPLALSRQIRDFYVDEKGPGQTPESGHDSPAVDGPAIKALMAPHIDIRSGGPCFAHAYHALSISEPPDLFVILGTGHHGLDTLYGATRKNFDTPWGVVETDRDFMDRLSARYGPELFDGEMAHKNEHVIEFQTIFLRHLYPNRPIRIAPILCSYNYQHLFEKYSEVFGARINAFCAALKETIAETPGNVCVIASVDLAHIGPMYGDDSPVDDKRLSMNEAADQQLLENLSQWDVKGFESTIQAENDARRICGFPCLHTMLMSVDAARGRLLSYDVTAMDQNQSYVSFASMAFWE